MVDIITLILQLFIQLLVSIPILIALVKFITKAIKEKNWSKMTTLALKLMGEAEGKFETGLKKEDYVVNAVMAAAKEMNYNISEIELKAFISNTVSLSKKININSKIMDVGEKTTK